VCSPKRRKKIKEKSKERKEKNWKKTEEKFFFKESFKVFIFL
jgi:hypothetical protein